MSPREQGMSHYYNCSLLKNYMLSVWPVSDGKEQWFKCLEHNKERSLTNLMSLSFHESK